MKDKYDELGIAIVHLIQDPKNSVALDTLNITSILCYQMSNEERGTILAVILSETRKLISA